MTGSELGQYVGFFAYLDETPPGDQLNEQDWIYLKADIGYDVFVWDGETWKERYSR